MPLAHVKFFEEPREYTQEQIDELEAAGLLREPVPAAAPEPAPRPAAPPSPPTVARPE